MAVLVQVFDAGKEFVLHAQRLEFPVVVSLERERFVVRRAGRARIPVTTISWNGSICIGRNRDTQRPCPVAAFIVAVADKSTQQTNNNKTKQPKTKKNKHNTKDEEAVNAPE